MPSVVHWRDHSSSGAAMLRVLIPRGRRASAAEVQVFLVRWDGLLRIGKRVDIDEQVVMADIRRRVAGPRHAHVGVSRSGP